MQYMGGKHRQGKHIGAFVNRWRKPGQVYWEPFVGTMGALCHIESGVGPVYASDFCGPLVALLCAVQGGWIPPAEEITEEQYRWYKGGNGEPRMRAFVGFGCSYGGKWFGGLARDKAGTAGRRKGAQNSWRNPPTAGNLSGRSGCQSGGQGGNYSLFKMINYV